jgi:2-polyprenyl-6-methoxyphenol hydroxylase-like FAD-dependent oxidoreductase
MPAENTIVLGAGFQGVCVALALQCQGHAVTLIDKAPDCMTRASLRNEGKIHLGFVYANDASFRTSGLMLRSSLAFAGLIEKWLKARLDWLRQQLKTRDRTTLVPARIPCGRKSRRALCHGSRRSLRPKPPKLLKLLLTL